MTLKRRGWRLITVNLSRFTAITGPSRLPLPADYRRIAAFLP